MMKQEAFCELVMQYKDNLFRAARCILRNETDAEDAVCEAIVKAYTKLWTLKSEGAFRAWMMRITVNEAYTVIRRRREIVGLEMAGERSAPQTEDLGLLHYVNMLGEDMRMPVLLYYFEDIRIKDIAVILGLPENTVKSRLRRAKEKLRELLAPEVEAYGF